MDIFGSATLETFSPEKGTKGPFTTCFMPHHLALLLQMFILTLWGTDSHFEHDQVLRS